MISYDHWRNHGIVGQLTHVRIADLQNDIELTRKILIAVQEKEALRPTPIQLSGYEPVLVMRHVKRLLDDGMLEGTVSDGLGMDAPLVFVSALTTAGHRFLAALEQQDIWNKLTTALSPGQLAALSMREIAALAKDLALAAAKKKLGLSD